MSAVCGLDPAIEDRRRLARRPHAPNDSLIFIESVMGPHDAPAAAIHSSNNGAELNYGPRGPQHRASAQLQPA